MKLTVGLILFCVFILGVNVGFHWSNRIATPVLADCTVQMKASATAMHDAREIINRLIQRCRSVQ